MEEKEFDEKAKEALELLFDNFWILREKDAENYQLIREREGMLRRYISEKFGFRFIIHQHFIKMEKIPVEPESWMGVQEFTLPMDYALFCCLLAFLENKMVDEQFLLSELCEEIISVYPGVVPLDWTNYNHRKSLIRVLQTAKDYGVIKVIDGDIHQFSQNDEQEVLYEVPLISRYFMRSYPKDLFQFGSLEQLLEEEWKSPRSESRRHRVYRKLFLSPSLLRDSTDDADFNYLRNFRNRIREDIEKHTGYKFELYKNTALLTVNERRGKLTLFPDQRAVMDVILQVAGIMRERHVEFPRDELGRVYMTAADFDRILEEAREAYSIGWGKALRESSQTSLFHEIYSTMVEWRLAAKEKDTGRLILFPLLARTVGIYPKDFQGGTHS
ncbi:TIGR02678 family protein [Bacillus massilinigeriensis]|uniref:TIGR02678 family protein n=1 Tax=Bacillus mediterraneensis TaxID=1805474 RepID=UPI0008F8EBDE|nr:TIGR02678 family protein [Bacillus mediterraneensis]